jgi:hypothetical protein
MEGMSSSGGLEIGISCYTGPHFGTGGQKHTHTHTHTNCATTLATALPNAATTTTALALATATAPPATFHAESAAGVLPIACQD